MYKTIEQFYNSTEWKKCRESYKKMRRGLCERCLAKGLITQGEEVHHKKRLTLNNINDKRVTTNFDNLELLCSACHQQEHRPDRRRMFTKTPRRYTVDAITGAVSPLTTTEDGEP